MDKRDENKLKGKIKALELNRELAEDKIKITRKSLYLVGAITLISGLIPLFTDSHDKFLLVILSFIIGSIILFLGYWTLKQPLTASIIAAVLITLLYGGDIYIMLLSSKASFMTIVIKVAVCLIVYSGLYHAFQWERIMREYKNKKSELEVGSVND